MKFAQNFMLKFLPTSNDILTRSAIYQTQIKTFFTKISCINTVLHSSLENPNFNSKLISSQGASTFITRFSRTEQALSDKIPNLSNEQTTENKSFRNSFTYINTDGPEAYTLILYSNFEGAHID